MHHTPTNRAYKDVVARACAASAAMDTSGHARGVTTSTATYACTAHRVNTHHPAQLPRGHTSPPEYPPSLGDRWARHHSQQPDGRQPDTLPPQLDTSKAATQGARCILHQQRRHRSRLARAHQHLRLLRARGHAARGVQRVAPRQAAPGRGAAAGQGRLPGHAGRICHHQGAVAAVQRLYPHAHPGRGHPG